MDGIASADDRSSGSGTPQLVMVIDDDSEMRAVLRDLLTREGFRVHEEAGGEHAIPSLEGLQPDVVVVDKEMPGANGLDLVSYIGRRHPGVPVILVTAFGGAATHTEAMRRGAAGYLEKPFRVAQLVDMLRHVTRREALGPRSASTSHHMKGRHE
jgi:two-component system response regulator FlrC